jgi:hypothetical protein
VTSSQTVIDSTLGKIGGMEQIVEEARQKWYAEENILTPQAALANVVPEHAFTGAWPQEFVEEAEIRLINLLNKEYGREDGLISEMIRRQSVLAG